MAGIEALGAGPVIAERVAAGRPVLGICVGMQILFDSGVEHGVETKGLGPAARRGHQAHRRSGSRTWAGTPSTCPAGSHAAATGCPPESRFYFVHSYAASDLDALHAAGARVITASHDLPFAAAVELGSLSAAQFHPEKSGDAGLRAAAQLGQPGCRGRVVSKERARRRAERLAVLEKEKAARARGVARRQQRRALVEEG